MEEEIWKPIPSSPHYEASSLGQIRSLIARRGTRKIPKILKLYPGERGYLQVSVNRKTRRVHNLVLEAFVGPKPEGLESCHNDSNKLNNSISNLRYDTRMGNVSDIKIRGGIFKRNRKLTIEDVLLIRRTIPNQRGMASQLALQFGIHKRYVLDVAKRETWKWLEG